MSKYFVIVSFELHKGQLENWQTLSKEIYQDLKTADGFISRDSGIDENKRVYCLVKWQSKTQQESNMKRLESGDNWGNTMARFGSIANMDTMQSNNLDIF